MRVARSREPSHTAPYLIILHAARVAVVPAVAVLPATKPTERGKNQVILVVDIAARAEAQKTSRKKAGDHDWIRVLWTRWRVLGERKYSIGSSGGSVRQRRAGKGNKLRIPIQLGCIPMHALLHLKYCRSYHAK